MKKTNIKTLKKIKKPADIPPGKGLDIDWWKG